MSRQLWHTQDHICFSQLVYIHSNSLHMSLVEYVYFHLMNNCTSTVTSAVYISHLQRSIQFDQPISSFLSQTFAHKHLCCSTIEQCFHCSSFVSIYLFDTHIYPHFLQRLKCSPHISRFLLLHCLLIDSSCHFSWISDSSPLLLGPRHCPFYFFTPIPLWYLLSCPRR